MTTRFGALVFSAMTVCFSAGCGLGAEPTDRQDALDKRDYSLDEVASELGLPALMAVEPEKAFSRDGVTHYVFDANGTARCLDGSPFQVSIRKSDSANVLLFLQGGGACWDRTTCLDHPISRTAAELFTPTAYQEGIFADDPENPFRGWNVVFAPYCDGSLWFGNADPDYEGKTAYHRGMANVAAAVALLKREFPSPTKLTVAGMSAGGYGTLMGYVVSRFAFEQVALSVINDSGPWLINGENEAMASGVLNHWGAWDAAAFHPPVCPTCVLDLYRIANWAIKQDPDTRWGLLSYDRDLVIADVYMGYGDKYRTVLTETLDDIENQNPDRFHSYLIPGFGHTRLGTDAIYEVAVDGRRLSSWLDAMITDDPDWESVRTR